LSDHAVPDVVDDKAAGRPELSVDGQLSELVNQVEDDSEVLVHTAGGALSRVGDLPGSAVIRRDRCPAAGRGYRVRSFGRRKPQLRRTRRRAS
jgi:hypothetical protein